MPAPWWGAAVAALAYLGLVARHIMGPLRALKMLPALLLAAAVAPSSTYGAAALVASAAGDAFLLDKTRFLLHGLAAFLVGHALFAAAFVGASGEWPSPVVLGALALLAGTVTAVVRPRSGTLRVAVPVYALGLCAMAATATTLGPIGGTGGAAFLVSDAILAVHQFKRPVPGRDLLVASTYYGALLALSAALLTATSS